MALKFTKLDRETVRALPPGDKLSEHGIVFQRLANGDGCWKIAVMVDGVRISRVLGLESAGVTRTQCEIAIEKLRTEAREGRLNLPKGRKTQLGFRQAAAKYLERLEQEGGKNLDIKARHFRLNLVPFFGETPLAKIATFDVERYKKERLSQASRKGGDTRSDKAAERNKARVGAVSSSTINRELATLSHLLTKAVEWGWLDHKPARTKRLKEEPSRLVYLTAEQSARLLEAARHDQSREIFPFIFIGLETSMRLMEILSTRLDHIDLPRRVIYIPQAKSGAREQPITASLAAFLSDCIQQAAPGQVFLFPSKTSKSGHMEDITHPFRRVVADAGLNPKEIVRHTLRHTAISHLVQAGVDLPTVQRISGHKTASMVFRYAHQNGEHIQEAMDKLEERYRLPTSNVVEIAARRK